MCSRANLGKLAEDNFGLPSKLLFGCCEVKMEAELNELKQFCIIPFKDSKEKQLIESNEYRTLMMKFVLIGITITSDE